MLNCNFVCAQVKLKTIANRAQKNEKTRIYDLSKLQKKNTKKNS